MGCEVLDCWASVWGRAGLGMPLCLFMSCAMHAAVPHFYTYRFNHRHTDLKELHWIYSSQLSCCSCAQTSLCM